MPISKIGAWLIALALLILLILFIIAIKNESESALSIFNGIRNFGDLFK